MILPDYYTPTRTPEASGWINWRPVTSVSIWIWSHVKQIYLAEDGRVSFADLILEWRLSCDRNPVNWLRVIDQFLIIDFNNWFCLFKKDSQSGRGIKRWTGRGSNFKYAEAVELSAHQTVNYLLFSFGHWIIFCFYQRFGNGFISFLNSLLQF